MANGNKPVYDDSYDRELEESYENMRRRPAFRYDAGSDPLYAKIKDDTVSAGRRAMKDTYGQAANLSGGYSSSYAENAAQQSYDSALTKLSDVIPSLYELAYSRYTGEGERLKDEYDALRTLRDDEYRRYAAALDDYNRQSELAYQRERDARADAERAASAQRSEAESRAKYGDFSGYAALYGEDTAQSMKKYWISKNPLAAYNMGLIDAAGYYRATGEAAPGFELPQPDRVSAYYPNTAPDGRDAKLVQRELRSMGYNIAVDGAWGPKSQAAWEKAYGK